MSKGLDTFFPFYTTKAEQDRYKDYVDKTCYIFCSTTAFPRWIIRRPHNAGTNANFLLQVFNAETDALYTAYTASSYLTVIPGTTYDYVAYYGGTLSPAMGIGLYYIKLTDVISSIVYYSETFQVNAVSDFTQIVMKCNTQLSNIYAGFTQNVYLNNVLKTPQYIREDTGEKRDGIMVFEKRIKIKVDILRWNFAPEWLVDAIMLIPFMDEFTLYLPDGNCYTYDEIDVQDPQWNADNKGATAYIEAHLKSNVVIKKVNFIEMGCNCTATTSSGSAITTSTGSGTLTAGVPATIVLSSAMDDDTYQIIPTCVDALNNPVPHKITNKTTAGFDVTATDDATFTCLTIQEEVAP